MRKQGDEGFVQEEVGGACRSLGLCISLLLGGALRKSPAGRREKCGPARCPCHGRARPHAPRPKAVKSPEDPDPTLHVHCHLKGAGLPRNTCRECQ